jgi:NDP-sugar pyrophosphorylase family protein
MVAKIKDKYLTSADESIQLRYLLAKDDVDDIYFACTLIANRLKKELKNINVNTSEDHIIINALTNDENYISIDIDEAILQLSYICKAPMKLFNKQYALDEQLLKKIRDIILNLGFKKEKEEEFEIDELITKHESFKIEIQSKRRY